MKITFNFGVRRRVPAGRRRVASGLSTFACVLVLLAACDETTSQPKDVPDAAARRVLLDNIATQVIAQTYASFSARADALAATTASYATSQSAEDLVRAQDAFKDAMRVWQRAEMFQIGPAAKGADNLGSQNLREQIYNWPDAYPCGVDVALVDESYKDAKKFVADSYPNVRGLSAIERLLFEDTNETACPGTNAIVKDGSWDALVKGDLAARRAAYAKVLGDNVKANAAALVKAFSSFQKELKTAGDSSKLFETSQDALNALSNALFYLDTKTKDMKLAAPLNLNMACGDDVCPDKLELSLSGLSKDAIVANLEAFRDVFRGLPPSDKRGKDMWGLADLLKSISQDSLANEMNTLLDKALTETNKIEPSLEAAISGDSAQAKKAYMALQELTMRLKTDFISKLALKPPMSAAADND